MLVEGELGHADAHPHGLGLSGAEVHLAEALEALDRPLERGGRVRCADVELGHGAAGPAAGVGDTEANAERAAGVEPPGRQPERREAEARVAPAVAERV